MPILALSVMALLVAGTFSMITITGKSSDNATSISANPEQLATEAARGGLEAAKWNIECHGRTTAGGLGPRYYINGATYNVQWDDVNMQDSTVHVRSIGTYTINSTQNYQIKLESDLKIEFLPNHKNIILSSYYSQKRDDIAQAPSR